MRVLAPAKINLFLEVNKKRLDGFHDIETIFQSVSLYDVLHISLAPSGVHLHSTGPFSRELPPAKNNIIVNAVTRVLKECKNRNTGVSVRLTKNIPLGAGLGGGSTDAAAIIRSLPRLLKKNISKERALSIARKLGSDVPFALKGGCAWGTGKGDILKSIKNMSSYWIVLVYPHVQCATARIYRRLKMKKELTNNENIHNIIKHLQSGSAVSRWGKYLFNRLEDAAFSLYYQVENVKSNLTEAGGAYTVMSGSGSVVYSVTDTYDKALKIKKKLLNISNTSACSLWIVHPVNNK